MSDLPFMQRGIATVLARTREQNLGRRLTERSSLKFWMEEDAYRDWFLRLIMSAGAAQSMSMQDLANGGQAATLFGVQVIACEARELRNPDAAGHLTFTEPDQPAAVLTQSLDTWEFPALTPRHLFSPLQRRGGVEGYSLAGRTAEERRPVSPVSPGDAVLRRSMIWFDAGEAVIEARQPLYHSSRPASASSGRMMKSVGADMRVPTTKLKRKWGRE